MLVHSSPTARLDGGKDRGRRVREQGTRGETKCGGVEGEKRCKGGLKRGAGVEKSDQVHKFECGAACVCVLDLEPDGVAAVLEVMRSQQGKMGKDDQWEKALRRPPPHLL